MPVHRHVHDKASSVYAFRTELDAWAGSRRGQAATPTRSRRWTLLLAASSIAVVVACAVGVGWVVLAKREAAWSSPLDGARLTLVTHFEGTEHAAAISRDGTRVAFLSDRDGQTDVWLTALGSGQFTNLTRGRAGGLVNPSVRSVGFSPDGTLVTFWRRQPGVDAAGEIATWAVGAAGGEPRPYLVGAAEFDWSGDGARLVYHTTGSGDPTYVRDPPPSATDRLIFTAPHGLHAHFPLWGSHDRFIYFVQGSVGESMDVWRIPPSGGAAERLTHHASHLAYPVVLNERTLMYLAADEEGGGPWVHVVDVERRAIHRLATGIDTYTSLSASGDGRRIAATLTRHRETLWSLQIPEAGLADSVPTRWSLPTGRGTSPRLGHGYLLYVSSEGGGDALWKVAGGTAVRVWGEPGTRILGSAAVAPDGRGVALSVERGGRARLVVMNLDGGHARTVTASLALRGAPAWTPDGRSLTVAATDDGVPRLFTVPVDGGTAVRSVLEYSASPAWSPDGRFVAYSGPDVGPDFRVKALEADGRPHHLPDIRLTRGARTLRFLAGRPALVVLRGELGHKDLWLVDLETGEERQLTRLPTDFHVRDFDISPDGREAVLDRVQEESDIVLLELARR
jgi:Tol biopolymer transport system component